MARTTRKRGSGSIIREFLEREHAQYKADYIERAQAGLVDPERMLDFEDWAEDFAASNF
jgi:hypothetical protein